MKFVGVSAPAWTIIGERIHSPPKKSDAEDADRPPPVIVDADQKSRPYVHERFPAWEFPKTKRPMNTSSAPALKKPRPATAQPATATDDKPKGLKPSFSKANRFIVNKEVTPGPADYAEDRVKPMIARRMPNFSMAYKQETDTGVFKNALGPNAYQLNYRQKEPEREKTFKFGNEIRPGLKQPLDPEAIHPGPGAYENNKPERPNSSSTRGTFSKATRDDLYKAKPAYKLDIDTDYIVDQHTIEYQSELIKETYANKNSVRPNTAAVTRQTNDNTSSTGAGTETIGFNGTKINAPVWKFGTGSRPPLNGLDLGVPGPGSYYKKGEFSNPKPFPRAQSASCIPKARRRPLNDFDPTPGVGEYNLRDEVPTVDDTECLLKPKSLLGGPLYTFRGKFLAGSARDDYYKPGPGQYEYDHTYGLGWSRGRSSKFGTSVRYKTKLKDTRPGPGSYEIKRTILNSEGVKFARSKRPPPNNGTDKDVEIGPGQYNLKSTVPQLQCYEMLKMMEENADIFNYGV